MKHPKDLSCDEIVTLLESVQSYLYLDLDEQGQDFWNPEKSWSGDEFDFLARTLRQYGLVPAHCEPVQPLSGPKRYVLYDFDRAELVGSRVYENPSAAASDANELNDVIVARIILPQTSIAKPPVPEPCDCQHPGQFCSGVRGILAQVKNCRVVAGGKVERCDQCQRYPSDQAACVRLTELGML